MPRRGENIRKRSDGRWEARYPQGKDSNGRTKYKSVYGKTYREAKEKQRQALNRNAPVLSDAVPMFDEILKMWMERNCVKLKASTIYRYEYLIQTHIAPSLGKKYVNQITGQELAVFLSQKSQHGRLDGNGGLSSAYVRSIMLIIHSAMDYAAELGYIPQVRISLPSPHCPDKQQFALTSRQQRLLEEALTDDTNPTEIGVWLALYSGLRLGEICALKWEDVDLEQRVIHIRHTVTRVPDGSGRPGATQNRIGSPKSTASYRIIPICSKLESLLKSCREASSSDYVIPNGSTFLSPRTFTYRFHRLAERAGLPDIHFHILRHTFATQCIAAGVDIKSLSEILGHKTPSVTLSIYVHSTMDQKRREIEKLVSQ